MKSELNYEKDTQEAYKESKRAEDYKKQLSNQVTWACFTMWREKLCVRKALRECSLSSDHKILDMPCGTGILASVLNNFSASIVASDISEEMMLLALKEYEKVNFLGFVQADIVKMPFRQEIFDSIIILGFMHRIPRDLRELTLKESTIISKNYIIVSYSIDSLAQRLKQWIIKKIHPGHKAAPAPLPYEEIIKEFEKLNLTIMKSFNVVPFLSAEMVFLLKKDRK